MRIRRTIWFTLLVSATLLAQGRFESLPPQSASSDRTIDVKGLEAKHADMDAVYLERLSDYENVVRESAEKGYDWNLLVTEYRKFVVFDPEAEPYTTLSIELPKDHELEKISLSVYSPGGKFRQFGREDLKEARDSNGSITYKFAFPDVVKGSVITEAYVLRRLYCFQNAPLHYNIGLQYRIPCERTSFRIVYPSSWEIGIKKIGENQSLPVTLVEDKNSDLKTLSYKAENVPAVLDEPFSPFYKEVAVYADVYVKRLNMRIPGWQPVSYKAPKDWSALSKEFKDHAMDRDPIFSRRVEATLEQVTVGCDTGIQKLDAIISWIQSNIRWVSYSEAKANHLNEGNLVDNLERKMGTDDQISALAMSMLLKANIDTRFILMHSAEDGYFDQDFFSYSQLSTPALLAQIDGKSYVVFPYRKRMPVDYVPEAFHGQRALAIDRKGKAEFIQLPSGSHSINEMLENYQITLQEDGKIRVEEEKILRGSAAYSTRRNLAGMNYRETENALKRMIAFSEGKITLKSHAVVDQQEYKKPLKILLEYEIENLVTITPAEVIFNTSRLFSPVSKIKAKDTDRQNPIRIYNDETSRKTVKLIFPDTWSPSTPLKDFKQDNRFGTLEGTYRAESGKLTGELALTLKKTSESKESYPELVALAGRKNPHALTAIVFKVKRKS